MSRSRRRTVKNVEPWQLVSEPHFVRLVGQDSQEKWTQEFIEDLASVSRVSKWAEHYNKMVLAYSYFNEYG